MPNKNRRAHLILATLAASAALTAGAQTALIRPAYQYPSSPTTGGAASIQLGSSPVFFTPYLGVAVGHDDNVLLTRDHERSSTLWLISPGLALDARDSNKVFQLAYQSQAGRYAQSRGDDYIDHTVNTQFDWAMSSRNFLRLGLNYVRGHDPRNSTDRPVSDDPDKFRLWAPSVTYALGVPGARGRVELYAGQNDIEYVNNRAFTRINDRITRNYGGAFYWRVMPKTYLLAEARESRIRFDDTAARASADERRFFGGVSWEPTAATSGTVKFGTFKRNFLSDLPDETSSTWEATVSWSPRTYSKFDFYSVRVSTESTGLGSFIISSIAGVNWSHSWSTFLNTGVLLRYQKDAYQNFDRTDETKSLGLKVGYRFRRWLTLGAEYTHTSRSSSTERNDYDKNLYLLTATASM